MCPAMARQSVTSSAREAADVAAACIRAGMSVSSTRALPSNILRFFLCYLFLSRGLQIL
jgi:hypothetical protein